MSRLVRNDVGYALLRVAEATGVLKTMNPYHEAILERDRTATAALQLFQMEEMDCVRELLAELQVALDDAHASLIGRGGKPSKTGLLPERAVREALAILDEFLRQQDGPAPTASGIDDGGDQ